MTPLPDDRLLLTTLRDRFGHASFRPGQLEIIKPVLAGRPTLAVMPTGAGKSLCYQLPALLLDGVTLVISPLLALMRDQVDALTARGIPAAYINSSQSEEARTATEKALSNGRLRLVLVAPERFRSASFMRALASTKLSLVAVDEAHCISEWGHAFRPDYERLGEACLAIAPPRLLALTATATPDVRQDIIRSLRMHSPHVAVAGFDRPNLHLEVHALAKEAEKRDSILKAVRTASPAIVYTATRRHAGELALFLQRRGVRAAAYHAGLTPGERERTQEGFSKGTLDVVTATNAFGLGVDKQDVRLVIHAEIPRSLESYYQEVGRGGRDGAPAAGVLYFSEKDVILQRYLLRLAHPAPELVRMLFDRARKLGRAVGATELAAFGPKAALPAECNAALAYLESLGILNRRTVTGSFDLELVGAVSTEGDSLKSALARLMGRRKASVPTPELARALGAKGASELEAMLGGLEASGDLRRKAGPARARYDVTPGAELTTEHLRRLRMRGARDRARLLHIVELARRRRCRRHELLKALGEANPPARCQGCDVCAGPRFEPVRSRLAPHPDASETSPVSDPSDMFPGLSTALDGDAPIPRRGEPQERPSGA